jgi:hypothetical protein
MAHLHNELPVVRITERLFRVREKITVSLLSRVQR